MKHKNNHWLKLSRRLLAVSWFASLATISTLLSAGAYAQNGSELRSQTPELADLFNAIAVTNANALEKIAAINADPATEAMRNQLQMQLTMQANMTMSEMMAAGMGHGDMAMDMNGPFGDLETQARVELIETLRGEHSDEQGGSAFADNATLGVHVGRILQHGRNFESQLVAIYLDSAVTDKQAAVASAIADYLSDNGHSVATVPKNASYLLSHPHANALKSAFPRITGLLWSNQWVQLATLEAVVLEYLDSDQSPGIEVALERYWNKIGSAAGMTMFPAPTELPMAPAITPNLYSQSPEAAIIIDNLNVLETLVADILSYPNLADRQALIEQLAAEFTSKEENLAASVDYLLFALRGGIYNQGGPAVGELMRSERNRSRSAMDMQHNMIMSVQ